MADRASDLARIEQGLEAARKALEAFTPGAIASTLKEGGSPVTEADTCVDTVLKELLWTNGDGWLSEETADNADRLDCRRVWVVDPVDGTKEFVQGIPEWCVSIGLVEDRKAVAGGILNPATGKLVLGSIETGVTLNGKPVHVRPLTSLDGMKILASRSEVGRGEWDRFHEAPFEPLPMGSVAYKLSLVAAGEADATFTLVPKHEWDVAAGTALCTAAGARVMLKDGAEPTFNRRKPLFQGLIAVPEGVADELLRYLETG